VILAIVYRVRSPRGTQFCTKKTRIWRVLCIKKLYKEPPVIKKSFILFFVFYTFMIQAHKAPPGCPDQMQKAEQWLETGSWLPFRPALPSDFVLRSLHSEAFGLSEGVVWSTKECIEDLRRHLQEDPNFVSPLTGALSASFSWNIQQLESNEWSESEQNMMREAKAAGLTGMKFESLKWGEYPIKAFTGRLPDGKPLAMAYMGLNQAGPTILFRYWFPANQSSYEKDWAIWKHFLYNTVGVPVEEVMKQMESVIGVEQSTKLE
jgi:hypothetical protein